MSDHRSSGEGNHREDGSPTDEDSGMLQRGVERLKGGMKSPFSGGSWGQERPSISQGGTRDADEEEGGMGHYAINREVEGGGADTVLAGKSALTVGWLPFLSVLAVSSTTGIANEEASSSSGIQRDHINVPHQRLPEPTQRPSLRCQKRLI